MRIDTDKNPLVVFRAPRVGLANMLITWSRAVVFAKLNNLPWRSYGWSAFRPGPWLRGEARKRLYHGIFRSNMNWLNVAATEIAIRRDRKILFDPEPAMTDIKEQLVVFRRFPKGPDFFAGLQQHTEIIKQEFSDLMTAETHEAIARQEPVAIACHIRRGDFIAPSDPRYSLGGKYCQTPIQFFLDSVVAIRQQAGEDLPVTLFSNGHPDELQDLLALPRVSLAAPNSDIVDLVRMSRSDYLITSAWSSYSYLAGYLSETTILRLPYTESCRIRAESIPAFEGTLADFVHQHQLHRAVA